MKASHAKGYVPVPPTTKQHFFLLHPKNRALFLIFHYMISRLTGLPDTGYFLQQNRNS